MTNSPARSSVDVGAVIADTYIIEALIGQGGMGSVFLASHNRLPGKRVAIKMLHVELHDDDVITRFRREATIATQLDHPNIVRVDDFNVHDDGTPYLVLEYLEGENLAERIKAGPLPLDQVMSIMRMVGSAIAAAHQLGFVHRDLKPQNIFLIPTQIDGEHVEIAKVLDFGISKMLHSNTVKTQESTLLGTPQYMAPEQATGQHGAVDERTDVFALGSIVYEMLTGTAAFFGENIPAVVFKVVYDQPTPLAEAAPGTPAAVVAAVERAMQKVPDERFPTVNAFIEALTGRPLAQRSSMISLSPDRPRVTTTTTGKRAGQAAFANTVDSGSVDKSVAAKDASAAISPDAQTIASQDGQERTPTAAPPGLPVSRPRGLIVGMALVAVAVLAAVVYFATRGGHDTPKPAVIADATVTLDAAVVAQVVSDAAIDAAPEPDAAAIDAGVKKLPDAGTKPIKPGTIDRSQGDPWAWGQLDKAQAAYRSGDIEQALVFCNSVDNSSAASDTQRDLALLLRGTIHCVQQHNIGLSQADLRAMKGGASKQKLIALCPSLK